METQVKLGHKYRNLTRFQIVEVTEVYRGKVGYKVIRGNEYNPIKEFYCSFERFTNLYVLD